MDAKKLYAELKKLNWSTDSFTEADMILIDNVMDIVETDKVSLPNDKEAFKVSDSKFVRIGHDIEDFNEGFVTGARWMREKAEGLTL